MYVCLRNAYREADLRKAAEASAESVECAYGMLGRGPRGGWCVPFAQALIDGAREGRRQPELVS